MTVRSNGGLRRTGRTWSRDGLSGPIMVDDRGTEYECHEGSVADIFNGRLDAILAPLADKLVDELSE